MEKLNPPVEPVRDTSQDPVSRPETNEQLSGPVSVDSHSRRKRKGVWVWIVLIVVAIIGWRLFQSHRATQAETTTHQAPLPVPVVPGTVVQKDVPIYLDGLGTVQALNTVTVRARVDGQLEKIAFVEGQDVKAGDLLAVIDPAPFHASLEQAQAKQNQDQAQLSNARLDLTRDVDLAVRKVIAQQQLDTQKALVAQLEAAVKTDAAAVQSAQVQLGYSTIVSPIDGRTGIRNVDQGNIVHASDQNGLVTITQIQPISLIFTLPQQNLTEIHRHTAAGEELDVLALDRDNKTVLDEGKLSVIDNQIDPSTGTIRLKATFPNEHYQLWPGQFVNARLHLTTRKNGLVVPSSVIQRGPNGAYAFVIKSDNTVEIRPVKVAQVDNGEALIDEGLQAGERVVVDGQYKLQNGSKIKLPEAGAHMGARNGGGNHPPSPQ
jgi:multidrug efflux system membrane fusion protein